MSTAIKRTALTLAVLFALAAALFAYNYFRYFIIWHPTESVSFASGDIDIAGTLILPEGRAPYPAIVILHGSGPDDVNGPGYRVSANNFVRYGFAVLLYDKRGVGASGGDFETALYSDFIDDALSAVAYLAGRDDIDRRRIGLQGNSESGWFTPEIASRSGNVAFILNEVGPPLSWVENVIWEVRNDFLADGIAEADVDVLVDFTRRRWAYYQAAAADPSLADGPERDALEAELQAIRESVPGAADVLPESLLAYDEKTYADFAADTLYEPAPWLERLDIPMLYVFGEHDINVPTKKSVAFLEAFREEHDKDIEIIVLPGVGHALANWRGVFSAGYPPGYLAMTGDKAVEMASAATRRP